jgi:predicted hotdog family 3-hydroxylacyl-ACP dehydratase
VLDFDINKHMLHKPPMLFVDGIIEESGSKAKTLFTVKEDCIFLDETGRLARTVFIEIAAQSFAAVDSYQKHRDKGKRAKGFLVGIRDFFIYADALKNDELICVLEKTDEVGRLNICKAQVLKNGVKLAEGELRIFEIDAAGNPAES